MGEEIKEGKVIDVERIRIFCWGMLMEKGYLQMVLERAEPIPQFLGLTIETEDMINDVQESAFGIVYNITQNFKDALKKEYYEAILTKVNELLKKNIYKCEEPLFETALQLTQEIIESKREMRVSLSFLNSHFLGVCQRVNVKSYYKGWPLHDEP